MSRTSPSQLVSHLTCPRQRWFKSVRKMPDGTDKRKRTLGLVVHKCLERFLLADDQGRDASGNPVDMFPSGWEWAEGLRLDPSEVQNARRMVHAAVSLAVVRRIPGRRIEARVSVPIADTGCTMHMVEDVVAPLHVEDHKTTSSRRWALSKEALAKDPKMLCYAWEAMERDQQEFEETHPDVACATDRAWAVTLRLNYMCSNTEIDPAAWAVETSVPAHEVGKFWETVVVPATKEMVHLETRNLTDEDWRQVEGPRVQGACTQYGGCAFAEVCSGMLQPADLRERLQKKETPKTMTSTNLPQTTPPALPSVLDAAARRRVLKAGASPGPAISSTAAPVVAPVLPAAVDASPPRTSVPAGAVVPPPIAVPPAAPVPASAPPNAVQPPVQGAPPWAVANCQACKGTGVNSKGFPCRGCDAQAGRRGLPTSAQFKVWHDANGRICWSAPDGTLPPPSTAAQDQLAASRASAPPAAAKLPPTDTPAKVEVTQVATVHAPAALQPASQSLATQTVSSSPVVTLPRVQSGKKSARSGGFSFYLNAVPLDEDYVDLALVLAEEGKKLAAASNVGSVYELDAFRRRDALAAQAATVAASFEGKVVVAIGSAPDLVAYAAAFWSLAARKVKGVL